MSTNFPTALDDATTLGGPFINKAPPLDPYRDIDATYRNNLNDTVLAIEGRIGITGSSDTASIDWALLTVSGTPNEGLRFAGENAQWPGAVGEDGLFIASGTHHISYHQSGDPVGTFTDLTTGASATWDSIYAVDKDLAINTADLDFILTSPNDFDVQLTATAEEFLRADSSALQLLLGDSSGSGVKVVARNTLTVQDDLALILGSTNPSSIVNDATLSQFLLGIDATATASGGDGYVLAITSQGYIATDHQITDQSNPTLRIYSATDPTTDATQWISFAHDATDGILSTGKGHLRLYPFTGSSTVIGAGSPTYATANSDLYISGYCEIGTYLFVNLDITLKDARAFYIGNSSFGGIIKPDTTYDQLLFLSGSGLGRQIVISDYIYGSKDFGHPLQPTPTLYIHSDTDPTSDATQWMSFTHDQTNGVLAAGMGCLLKHSTTATITASTTQTQGQGPLTSNVNEVATVANTNDTVTLPAAAAGLDVLVINNGANTLQIFPASGDDLGAGVDTSTTLTSGSLTYYVAYDSTNWVVLV